MMGHQRGLTSIIVSLILLLAEPAPAAVLASIRPLAFIAAAIAQGVTSVEVLLHDGASPHHYTLRPSDLRRLQTAELVVWVGPEMETFLTKPLQAIAARQQLLLSREATITPLLMVDSQEPVKNHMDGRHQPMAGAPQRCCTDCQRGDLHLWLSPVIARQIAQLIQAKLLIRWPEKKARLLANLAMFEQRLTQAEQEIKDQLAPLRSREYFVFHDAYRYFELHFGLQQRGHFTINPMVQPGAQRLHQIRSQLQHGVLCVFAESQFKPAVIEAVVRGTKAKIGILDPLGMHLMVTEDSYPRFLKQLTQQFVDCLKD